MGRGSVRTFLDVFDDSTAVYKRLEEAAQRSSVMAATFLVSVVATRCHDTLVCDQRMDNWFEEVVDRASWKKTKTAALVVIVVIKHWDRTHAPTPHEAAVIFISSLRLQRSLPLAAGRARSANFPFNALAAFAA